MLDLILLVGLATFYSDKIISMSYHEIGGLVLFGLFVLHLIFNYKWIRNVFVKLFSRKMLLRTRILCLLDVLLLLSWVMVIVSGACISKVVFSFRVMGSWKMLHFFFAALSLILTGIHLGFHVKYLGINLKKILPIPLPGLVKKILVVALSVVIVVLGAMNYTDSGLSRWLSMPFAASAMGGPNGEMGGGIRIGRVLALVWQFGSVVLAVMTVTGWVDFLCLWAKRRIRAGKKATSQEE